MDKNNPRSSVSKMRVTPIKIDSIYIDFCCYKKKHQDVGNNHNHSSNRNTSVELSESATHSANKTEINRKNRGDFSMRKYVAEKIRKQYAERGELLIMEPNSNEAPTNMHELPYLNEALVNMDVLPNSDKAPTNMDELSNPNEPLSNLDQFTNLNEAPVSIDVLSNSNEAPANMDKSLTCGNRHVTINPSSIHNTTITTGLDDKNQQMQKITLEDPKGALSLSEGLGVHIREENPVVTEVQNAYPAFTTNWVVRRKKRSRRKKRKLHLLSDIYKKAKPIGERPTTTFQVVNVIEDFKLEQEEKEEECSNIRIRRRKHARKAININEGVAGKE